jgi:hypothetical protein
MAELWASLWEGADGGGINPANLNCNPDRAALAAEIAAEFGLDLPPELRLRWDYGENARVLDLAPDRSVRICFHPTQTSVRGRIPPKSKSRNWRRLRNVRPE